MDLELSLACRACGRVWSEEVALASDAEPHEVASLASGATRRLWRRAASECLHVDPCGQRAGSEHEVGGDGRCVVCGRAVALPSRE